MRGAREIWPEGPLPSVARIWGGWSGFRRVFDAAFCLFRRDFFAAFCFCFVFVLFLASGASVFYSDRRELFFSCFSFRVPRVGIYAFAWEGLSGFSFVDLLKIQYTHANYRYRFTCRNELKHTIFGF